jgi:hypothetical protein
MIFDLRPIFYWQSDCYPMSSIQDGKVHSPKPSAGAASGRLRSSRSRSESPLRIVDGDSLRKKSNLARKQRANDEAKTTWKMQMKKLMNRMDESAAGGCRMGAS